jgi:hypothetical protein
MPDEEGNPTPEEITEAIAVAAQLEIERRRTEQQRNAENN